MTARTDCRVDAAAIVASVDLYCAYRVAFFGDDYDQALQSFKTLSPDQRTYWANHVRDWLETHRPAPLQYMSPRTVTTGLGGKLIGQILPGED